MSWKSFRKELLAIYQPPICSYYTRFKVRQIVDLLGAMPGVDGPSDLTPVVVAEYIVERSKEHCARTVNGELDYVRLVCNYAEGGRHIHRSPFAIRKFKLRVGEKTQTKPLSREQISTLLAHLAAGCGTWEGQRLHALASLVAYTGLRTSEALHLQQEDISLDEGFLKVDPRRRLKTAASAAPVPLADRLIPTLREWLPRCESIWAFPGIRRKGPWIGGLHGTRAIDQFRKAGESIGITGATFLALRHSWATHAEYWGVGELAVQRVLRHTAPLTQRHYRHFDLVNLRQVMRGISFEEHDMTAQAIARGNGSAEIHELVPFPPRSDELPEVVEQAPSPALPC